MNRSWKISYLLIGVFGILGVIAAIGMADPAGVRTISQIRTSRMNESLYPPANISAQAGNVTELSLTARTITQAWQGYYGNITGTISLEDSSGNVFYNWSAFEPQGEIYASTNATVTWTGIRCFNWTGDTITLATEEARYGMASVDADGIDETFTQAGLDIQYFVGTRNITQESATLGYTCWSTNTYIGGSQVAGQFENSLLTDGSSLVFVTVIENDQFNNATDINGFDGLPHDFQLLVAEDGHDGQEDATTTYYFWAEIR